jgi:hypothetical protein
VAVDPIDRHARKQVLLTRIAFERIEMRRDVTRLQQASRIPTLLRALLGIDAGRTSSPGGARDGNLLVQALALWRRYRGVAMFLGSLAPIWGVAKGWRRIVLYAGIGTAAWVGWRALSRRREP